MLPLSIYDEVSGQKGLYQIDEADTIDGVGRAAGGFAFVLLS